MVEGGSDLCLNISEEDNGRYSPPQESKFFSHGLKLLPQKSSHAKKNIIKTENNSKDPFHSKPRELSLHALPTSALKKSTSSNVIFTRTTFDSFKLDPRLLSILQENKSNHGLASNTSTKIQSVAIPALMAGQNVLMKSQTGSGKTLAYLLPIIHNLMTSAPKIHRQSGTYALVLSPTRELCLQITDILAQLTAKCANIVSGSITGGEKKKSEKARLRKGAAVLVCTPGRLLDHLKSTESWQLQRLRWLVLDEADRLLDMGFEQTLLEIMSIIKGVSLPQLISPLHHTSTTRSKKCLHLSQLTLVLVSATITQSLQALSVPLMNEKPFLLVDADAESVNSIVEPQDLSKVATMKNNSVNRGVPKDGVTSSETGKDDDNDEVYYNNDDTNINNNSTNNYKRQAGRTLAENEVMHTPPQMAQYYMNVTCKWRLTALISFLYTKATVEKLKIMVFFSTCDAVDYHLLLLREAEWPTQLDTQDCRTPTTVYDLGDDSRGKYRSINDKNGRSKITSNCKFKHQHTLQPILSSVKSSVLGPDTHIYRLHGNMAHALRQQVYHDFCANGNCVLFCTDVAARGLDLPEIDWILQYDPPCDITDYVHRAGRTARKGEGGNALLFLLPTESAFVPLLSSHRIKLEALSLQSLFMSVCTYIPGALKFRNVDELAAVILQRRLENVVENNTLLCSAGQQAFRSFIRAYASHSKDTKNIFKIQNLHLGHVAKSFALRTNPTAMQNQHDIIGDIVNGKYMHNIDDDALKDKRSQRDARNEQYSLSNTVTGSKRKFKHNDSSNNVTNKSGSNNKTTKRVKGGDNTLYQNTDNCISTVPGPATSLKYMQKLKTRKTHSSAHGQKVNAKISVRKQMTDSMKSEFFSI